MEKISDMNKALGFSLVEMIVVLAVAAILAALAVPSFERSTSSSEVKKSARDLVTTLNTARAYAVNRRQNIVVVADGGDAGNEWGNPGWILRLPAEVDGDQRFDAPGDVTIDETRADISAFSLGPDGRVYDAAGANVIAQMEFAICPGNTSGVDGRTIQINQFGKVRNINKEDC